MKLQKYVLVLAAESDDICQIKYGSLLTHVYLRYNGSHIAQAAFSLCYGVGRDSSVGIVTRYGLDGPEIGSLPQA